MESYFQDIHPKFGRPHHFWSIQASAITNAVQELNNALLTGKGMIITNRPATAKYPFLRFPNIGLEYTATNHITYCLFVYQEPAETGVRVFACTSRPIDPCQEKRIAYRVPDGRPIPRTPPPAEPTSFMNEIWDVLKSGVEEMVLPVRFVADQTDKLLTRRQLQRTRHKIVSLTRQALRAEALIEMMYEQPSGTLQTDFKDRSLDWHWLNWLTLHQITDAQLAQAFTTAEDRLPRALNYLGLSGSKPVHMPPTAMPAYDAAVQQSCKRLIWLIKRSYRQRNQLLKNYRRLQVMEMPPMQQAEMQFFFELNTGLHSLACWLIERGIQQDFQH